MQDTKHLKRRGTFVGEVLANERLCTDHYSLRLAFDAFPPTQPGQFVQLQCRDTEEPAAARPVAWPEGAPPRLTQAELTGREPLLRRPFSLAGRTRENGRDVLEIIYRAIGMGTTWMSGVTAGAQISTLGPLGNAFRIFPDKPLAAVIGGGVGIPPMMYLAEALAAAGKKTVAFNGARTASLLPLTIDEAKVEATGHPTPCVGEFSRYGIDSVVATDDGTLGFAGVVSEALRDWLNAHVNEESQLAVYCCGPEPLMKSVGELCVAFGIRCQLALERKMACGMGTCQSCIVKVRAENEQGWTFKLCCSDGPVFDAETLLW
jgi:dihydroorotate dehydrogenase electron transfer subunit